MPLIDDGGYLGSLEVQASTDALSGTGERRSKGFALARHRHAQPVWRAVQHLGDMAQGQ